MTFFFTCLFIIVVFWRPQEWLIPWLYGFPILEVVTALAVLGLLMEASQKRVNFRTDIPHLYLLIGLWVASVLSHVAHTYWEGMMWTIYPAFRLCFFTWLLLIVLDSPKRLRIVAWIMVIMSSMMAFHALMQQKLGYGFAGQPPIIQWRPTLQRNVVRSWFFGIFGDPNDLAQMLSASVPFTFVLTKRSTLFSFLLGCGFSALLVSGIFATYSRGGTIGLIVAVALMIIRFFPSRFSAVSSILVVLIALLLIPYSRPYLDESAHDRVVFWGEANWAFKENPIFGVGYGMLEEEYVGGERSIHNAFVWCYASLGIVGYWFWYGLLQFSMIGAWRALSALKQSTEEEMKWLRRYAGFSMAGLGSFAVSSYFLSRAFIFPFFFLIGMVGAIPYVVEKLIGRPIIRPVRDVWVYGTLGALFSIVYIYVSIILLNRVFYG